MKKSIFLPKLFLTTKLIPAFPLKPKLRVLWRSAWGTCWPWPTRVHRVLISSKHHIDIEKVNNCRWHIPLLSNSNNIHTNRKMLKWCAIDADLIAWRKKLKATLPIPIHLTKKRKMSGDFWILRQHRNKKRALAKKKEEKMYETINNDNKLHFSASWTLTFLPNIRSIDNINTAYRSAQHWPTHRQTNGRAPKTTSASTRRFSQRQHPRAAVWDACVHVSLCEDASLSWGPDYAAHMTLSWRVHSVAKLRPQL